MKVSDRALHRLKAQAEGLLLPEEVRRMRRTLGLSQRETGLVIGGGPNAFQKYESGEILVSHAISSALRVLEAHPDALESRAMIWKPFGMHSGHPRATIMV